MLKFSFDHCIELNSTEASALYLYKNRLGHATAPEKIKLLRTNKKMVLVPDWAFKIVIICHTK